MKNLFRFVAAASVALGIGAMANASTDIPITLTEIESWDSENDGSNTNLLIDLAMLVGLPSGSPITVTGIGWDVEIRTEPNTPFGGSWLSEAVVRYTDADLPTATVFLTPGVGDGFPGTQMYSSGGIVDLTDVGVPDLLLTQGRLNLHFFESFNDIADQIDAWWNGTLTVRVAEMVPGAVVPLPSAAGLGLAGMGVLAGVRRRR